MLSCLHGKPNPVLLGRIVETNLQIRQIQIHFRFSLFLPLKIPCPFAKQLISSQEIIDLKQNCDNRDRNKLIRLQISDIMHGHSHILRVQNRKQKHIRKNDPLHALQNILPFIGQKIAARKIISLINMQEILMSFVKIPSRPHAEFLCFISCKPV